MEDFGDKQFYSVRGPEQAPEPKKRFDSKLLKRWLVLLSIIILLVLAVLIARQMMSDFTENRVTDRVEMDNLETQIELKVHDCSPEDQEYCRNKYWTQAAVTENDTDYCKQVAEDWFDSCVEQIANNLRDPEVCSEIKIAEQAVVCADTLYQNLAISSVDISICEKISQAAVSASCVDEVARYLAKSGNCPTDGLGVEECRQQIILLESIESGNCGNFERTSVEYASCIDMLSSTDSDSDGLTDLEEVEDYETDQYNADTDGDGYDDGTEIRGGYDPLR